METRSGLMRIYKTLQRLEELIGPYNDDSKGKRAAFLSPLNSDDLRGNFVHVMDDDLNTAAGSGLLFEKVRDINRLMDSSAQKEDVETQLIKERVGLIECANILGVLERAPSQFFQETIKRHAEINTEEIERLIKERNEARRAKNWNRADAIREELFQKEIVLEDGPAGTSWRFKVDSSL